jgi:hypothetical protein
MTFDQSTAGGSSVWPAVWVAANASISFTDSCGLARTAIALTRRASLSSVSPSDSRMSAIHCTRASNSAMTGNGPWMKNPRIPSSVDRVGLATRRSALARSLRAVSSGSAAAMTPVTRSSNRDHGIRPSADSTTRSST